MAEPESGILSHFLYSSTLYVDRRATQIQTVLGSCVSVCLYDQVLRYGGMNHFMLPIWKGEGLASPKYGNIAMEKLIEKMLQLGSKKSCLVAKVFGGAQQLDEMIHYNIGKRNIEVAEEVLKEYGIPIVASNVEGTTGRKIIFHNDTGLVYMKFITTS